MNKKIIASAAIAAALFAGSVAVPAQAATVTKVSAAAKVTVTAAQKKAVAAAVKDAQDNGWTGILVSGFKKPTAASKALVAYANKYVAANASDLTVTVVTGHASAGLIVVAADNNTATYIEVNGSHVKDGDTVQLPAGTTSVKWTSSPVNEFATTAVDGDTGLVAGDNILSFTVTAADGTEDIYSIDLQVASN